MGERLIRKDISVEMIQNLEPVKMKIEDLPQIAEIYISYWGTMCLYPDTTFERIIRQDLSYVYKIKDEVIAFCLIYYDLNDDNAEIALLCVKKEFKGNHLGKSLLSFCINYCKDLNYKNFSLHVSTTNMPAINLYKNLGFVTRDFIKEYYDDGKPEDNDAYFMTLNM